MDNLESKVELPFQIGTYHFDLNWKWFKVGTASLTYSCINYEDLPQEAKQVYEKGNIYKVIFEGKIDLPIVKLIAEKGRFTTYMTIEGIDVKPLLCVAETNVLRKETKDVVLYDYHNKQLTINGQKQDVNPAVMKTLRDPASHVTHILYTPRISEGEHLCGYYHDTKGNIHELNLIYTQKGKTLMANATISANTYFIDAEIVLDLPYGWDEQKKVFVPSLKQKVAIGHKILGKVRLDFTKFEPAQSFL